ncbi:MAG: RNase adapter RapZ [Bacteroidota bacterium]|nr:RNase adapter RapZ [Bacteroidota bacterium]MDP4217588.1 RNase adapter RapZ [Bacteroidota bacterium]MDP4244753.1 RNase adapter RapZ [Bacteroidota bacterium]MDP4253758.1 RNase adapter RapZ [Bacteroidota bacterium]MDP4258205.1 RNase adapter RapZ [Bacteroidota bacterium]
MQAIIEKIRELFAAYDGHSPITQIEKIPQSGSNRMYFRLRTNGRSYIATYNDNVKENGTFIYFSRHFRGSGCPVPEILHVNESCTVYLQEDLGDQSLLNELELHGHDEHVYRLFQKSLEQLAQLQIRGDHGLDYSRCITSREFGKQAILSDLLYFKYYFLDTLQIPYDKEQLIDDFEALSTYLTHVDHKYFMFRDFQSRNILIGNDGVHFIDFQGGMKGALQYDVASMLWQAKAELPDTWKDGLLDYYMDCVEKILDKKIDRTRFVSQYNGYVMIRLLQVLGAYGFRGLFERKAHFLTSIPLALRNFKWFLEHRQVGIVLPEFERLLTLIVREEVIHRFEPIRADERTPLVVAINSFSYKNGIPGDEGGNGGGFVFDCRGILNPGRMEEFKTLTGRDKGVKDFLEQQTRMPDFLNSVYNIVDIAVEDYIKRDFNSLSVSFGCTGGQHRSVYAADALARHLRNKFNVRIGLHHIVQDAKNWINRPAE